MYRILIVLLALAALATGANAQAVVGPNFLYGATYVGPPPGGGGSGVTGPGAGNSTPNSVPTYSDSNGNIQDPNTLLMDPTLEMEVYWRLDTEADGEAHFLLEDENEGTPILEYQIFDGPGGEAPARTRVGSPDTLELIFDDSGAAEGSFQVLQGLGGDPIQQYGAATGEHRLWYSSGSGGVFGVTDRDEGYSPLTLQNPNDNGGIAAELQLYGGVIRLEEGTLQLPDGPGGDNDCGDFTGAAGFATLCDDAGVLSVRHGTGAPIPLESAGGTSAHPGEEWLEVSTLGVSSAVVTVATVDTTTLTPSQGTLRLFAEVTQGADGTGADESAVYTRPARVSYGFGTAIEGTVGNLEDKDAAAATWDCVWVVDGTSLDLDCNGSAGPTFNYTGNVRYYTASGGPN